MSKAVKRNAIIMLNEQYKYIEPLSREERGLLIMAIFEHYFLGELTQQLSGATLTAYRIITSQIDEDGGRLNG